MVLGCVCVTVPVGIRAAFLGTCIWSLGVGDHDNVYLVAFLSGCYFFYFFIIRCCSFLRCSGILD
jgi:hypothetical protein